MGILSNRNGNINSFIIQEAALAAQLPIVVPGASITVDAQPMTTVQMVALLQAHITAAQAVEVERRKLAELVAARDALVDQIVVMVETLKGYVASKFGLTSSQYSALGFAPKKRTAPTVATMAAGVAKNLATRVVRHTMGPKQRLAVKAPAPATPPASVTPTPASPAGNTTGR
jgi:hypothetical protein